MSKQRIPQTPQSPEGYSASTPPSKPVSVVQLLIETWGPDTMRRLCEVCETFGVTGVIAPPITYKSGPQPYAGWKVREFSGRLSRPRR
jgi:hypothetical protein